MDEDAQQAAATRGLVGVLMLAVPIVSIVVVAVAYLWLYSTGAQGHLASARVVQIDFDACQEAKAPIADRLAWMGLPEPEWLAREGGFSLRTHLPMARLDAPPPEDTVAQSLSAPGVFEVRKGDDGEVLVDNTGVKDATVELSFLDMPRAIVELDREHAVVLRDAMRADLHGHSSMWVDGQRVLRVTNLPSIDDGRVELVLEGEVSDIQRVDFVAATALSIKYGPLPCDVTVVGMHDVTAP